MSVIPSTKRDVAKLLTQLADVNSAFQIISEEQRHINAKLDLLITLQLQNNPSLTMQNMPSLPAIEAPKKTVRIRNPPVVSRVSYQEDDPTEAFLDVTRSPKPTLKRPWQISEIAHLVATIQDEIDSEINETNDDENQETPKRPQAVKRSARLQNKKQKK